MFIINTYYLPSFMKAFVADPLFVALALPPSPTISAVRSVLLPPKKQSNKNIYHTW